MDLVILISLFVSWMRLMSISILTSSYMFISMCHKNTPSYNSSNTTGPQKRRRPGHGLQCELQALQAALRISGRWLLCEFRRWRRSPHGRCGWRGGTTSRAWPGVFRRVFMRNCLIRNSGWKKKWPFDVDVLSPMILGEIPWVWEVSKPWETPSGCCKPNMSQNDGFLRCWNGSRSQIPRQTCS